jgi:hypothetical protein
MKNQKKRKITSGKGAKAIDRGAGFQGKVFDITQCFKLGGVISPFGLGYYQGGFFHCGHERGDKWGKTLMMHHLMLVGLSWFYK